MFVTILKKHFILCLISSFFFLLNGCAMRTQADFTDEFINISFVFVPGGNFVIGSESDVKAQPVQEVSISDLFVGIYEVTFDQYDAYCKMVKNCEPPSDEGWGRGKRPVINVSWYDANAFAEWLSQKTGQHYRLPSEAEWEYFSRAGTATSYWTGETLPFGMANCRNCGSKWDNRMTAPVGSFPPNPRGLYDTAGNVAEWTLDDYQGGYDNTPPNGKPRSVPNGERKVQRGGAWSYSDNYLRTSARDYRRPSSSTNDAGFRLVLEPGDKSPVPIMK